MSPLPSFRYAGLLLLCLLPGLAAADPTVDAVNAAETAIRQGDYREASQQYQLAARNAPAVFAVDYLLLAADATLSASQPQQVESLLQQLPPSAFSASQAQRAGILRAKALLQLGQPAAALRALPDRFTLPWIVDGFSLRAQAQFATGDVLGGISTRMALESQLTGNERNVNRDALWQELLHAALPESASIADAGVRGWVELAQLARSGAPLSAYEDWRQRYPDHPGDAEIAAGIMTPAVSTGPLASGNAIGLLLPLTGPLAAAAKIIQSGALAAQTRVGTDAPKLLMADSATGLDAAATSLVTQGAAALIGPLRKEDVALYATRPPLRPTIALNYLDGGRAPPAGLMPFGLAPEDEARAAAEDALAHGRRRAVILAVEGDSGERSARAFRSALESRGGSVLADNRFATNAVDFSALLKRTLGLAASENRIRALAAIGIRAESQPGPRGDIDVIFLATRSNTARLLWPQLRYQRAGGIATYATAAAADSGNTDLGGLMVCDAPWRLDMQGEIALLRNQLSGSNPRTADAQRLFALGYDAYALARRAASNALGGSGEIAGLTGRLTLESDGAIHRHLACTALTAPRAEGMPGDDDDSTP